MTPRGDIWVVERRGVPAAYSEEPRDAIGGWAAAPRLLDEDDALLAVIG